MAELPAVWNERMEQYLGIRPPDDALGVLQDTHWSCGLLGLFPDLRARQPIRGPVFHQAHQDLPDLEAQIAQGVLEPLKTWLNEKIHTRGSRATASELVEEVTGAKLSADYFIAYLQGEVRGALRPQPMTCCKSRSWFAPRILRTSASA